MILSAELRACDAPVNSLLPLKPLGNTCGSCTCLSRRWKGDGKLHELEQMR